MGQESGATKRQAARRPVIIAAVVSAILAFVIGILIGRFATCPKATTPATEFEGVFLPGAPEKLIQDGDSNIADILIQTIDAGNIERNLKNITERPHIAGKEADYHLVSFLKEKFTEYGLDSVVAAPYDVLLSYPDPDNPNSVKLLNESGQIVFDSVSAESNYSSYDEVVRPFNSYSPAGDIAGELVYVNYGRVEDYDYLEKNTSINVTGKIVIARYGKIFRGSKVDIAARHGALGVIIYSDPADYSLQGQDPDHVFPNTWFLSPSGAQRGTIARATGDPLTPGYPATRTAYRLRENETDLLPKIPGHPIGYGAARHFLEQLEGEEVPAEWRGALNITYRFGPHIKNGWTVNMTITTSNSRRRIHNVIGVIKGEVEPDRYVLLGNHRDAWVYGAMDPSSGTAVMMEIARAMGQLVKNGRWRPRRSIVFCSWGAEEYGLIGSTEWAEQYVKSLGARAVAYVNIDIAVVGNDSFSADATPLLYKPLFEAVKKVPNPNEEEVTLGRKFVYDTWLNRTMKNGSALPEVGSLGSGSDHAPLLQIAGITSVDMTFTHNKADYPKLGGYPLYHTEFETFDAVKRLIDPQFKCHQAVARVGAELLRSMADSLIIPFNVSDYAQGLKDLKVTLDSDKNHGKALLEKNIDNYTDLDAAIDQFQRDVKDFEAKVAGVDRKNPMLIRMINDQLSLLEKAFLDSEGLPQRTQKKHLIFAENANDFYAGSSFPGLADLLFKIEELLEPEKRKRWQEVRHHFSVIVNAIQAAGYTLRDVARFVEEQY